ncbi:2-succinyl-5-enolpyruvyl-6-hydroxy-3-cyclohexene-1-carboxylic-acid synthase [Aquibacillus rhizosphaerae]|uniref:2-succinyl-5-enolpyruvyl-6-hydroxy-3-cyclohexene-1-carboxylate synthase n=1 Tax=Aquibacillus rhizosphaerae TaxID=3051431 RepID=A0ABT7LBC5_9BACI|nr:2-succinyl-5-enolpyruvyl-6-hydroxy-3-cyclohexene-1-carboxylic-acid synthase [Aquibacillus sp. LR5S19]MDL4842557.1 2-succinyl-5-enolpyruvyl-6-hydroxy-3-cyclohexene-1-carboxylic-acid synthase [Aquibacillus sp. LR5S19]
MEHTETLTRYVANFVDELHKSGLRDVVISPGSRSTPLAMTFAEHESITHWVNMDERSAAFFALGMAKQTNNPVALVCTSGTAAANYYPAVIEAYYSRIPLLILTADRPHELRDVGAPQAIEQIQMYGDYVKWFHEMALPENTEAIINYARGKASRAINTARQSNAGPIHLNFPFREPLVPDFTISKLWGKEGDDAYHHNFEGKMALAEEQVDVLVSKLMQFEKGLIVCGPQEDEHLCKEIISLAETWNIPILADPLSQLRTGNHSKNNVIESYDAILKSKKVRDCINPDFIIRFGAMPVSKPYLLLLKEKQNITHFVVEANEGHREPTGESVHFIYADPSQLCRQLNKSDIPKFDSRWLEKWISMNGIAKNILMLDNNPKEDEITEGHIVKHLAEIIPDYSTIFVGNSMPIRDMDTFFMSNHKHIKVLANRGANGIDGITSSALGAASKGNNVTLLIGDVSFFHDFNGLQMAKQYNINLTVVLINNNGGGIFSFLPQSNEAPDHFEVLFGTPLHIDFKHAITMYNGYYYKPSSWDDYRQALVTSYTNNGLSVIEMITNRNENVVWHKDKWASIEYEIMIAMTKE